MKYIKTKNGVYEVVDREYKNYEILGAIWTSKGLIYVAKMNDKGDWN